jgi:hypothetical protein
MNPTKNQAKSCTCSKEEIINLSAKQTLGQPTLDFSSHCLLVEQELLTLPEHLSSPWFLVGVKIL